MKEQILKFNKTVAEFLQWPISDGNHYAIQIQNISGRYHISEFRFHRDWEWIMELVYRLHNDHDILFEFVITHDQVTIYYKEEYNDQWKINKFLMPHQDKPQVDRPEIILEAVCEWMDMVVESRKPKEFTLDWDLFVPWAMGDMPPLDMLQEVIDGIKDYGEYKLDVKTLLNNCDEDEIPINCVQEQDLVSEYDDDDTLGNLPFEWTVKAE